MQVEERLVRLLSQRWLAGQTCGRTDLWCHLQAELGQDCEKLWDAISKVTLLRLRQLLNCGDQPHLVQRHLQMTRLDWLAFDMVLVHLREDPLQPYSILEFEDHLNREKESLLMRALREVFHLVQQYELETCSADQRAAAWVAAARYYNSQGAESSAMLLQRRWVELKAAARESVYALWQDPAAQVPALHAVLVRRFPDIVTRPPCSWRESVEQGLVALPHQLSAVTVAQVEAREATARELRACARRLLDLPPHLLEALEESSSLEKLREDEMEPHGDASGASPSHADCGAGSAAPAAPAAPAPAHTIDAKLLQVPVVLTPRVEQMQCLRCVALSPHAPVRLPHALQQAALAESRPARYTRTRPRPSPHRTHAGLARRYAELLRRDLLAPQSWTPRARVSLPDMAAVRSSAVPRAQVQPRPRRPALMSRADLHAVLRRDTDPSSLGAGSDVRKLGEGGPALPLPAPGKHDIASVSAGAGTTGAAPVPKFVIVDKSGAAGKALPGPLISNVRDASRDTVVMPRITAVSGNGAVGALTAQHLVASARAAPAAADCGAPSDLVVVARSGATLTYGGEQSAAARRRHSHVLRLSSATRPLTFGGDRVLCTTAGARLPGTTSYWLVGGGRAPCRVSVRADSERVRNNRLHLYVQPTRATPGGDKLALTPVDSEQELALALAARVPLHVYNVSSGEVLNVRNLPEGAAVASAASVTASAATPEPVEPQATPALSSCGDVIALDSDSEEEPAAPAPSDPRDMCILGL